MDLVAVGLISTKSTFTQVFNRKKIYYFFDHYVLCLVLYLGQDFHIIYGAAGGKQQEILNGKV